MTTRHAWSIPLAGVLALVGGCGTDPVAATDDPEPTARAQSVRAEPVQAEPVAQAQAPEPKRLTDRPAWWLDEPMLTPTGFAATVEAEGASVLDARAAAVDLAMETAAAHDKADSARIDKTLIINPSPGVYKAYVYVSTPDVTTADASEAP